MGNICRSPTAEGCFRKHLQDRGIESRFEVDSCGTISAHVGQSPDRRSQREAQRQGVDLSSIRARQLCNKDFEDFDFILAMDKNNLTEIERISTPSQRAQTSLLLNWLEGSEIENVPDPYYGGTGGFKDVFNLIQQATHSLLDQLERAD